VHYVVLHVLARALAALDVNAPGAYAAALFGGGFALSALAAWALFAVAERFYFARR
jgi:hypothetical protein